MVAKAGAKHNALTRQACHAVSSKSVPMPRHGVNRWQKRRAACIRTP